MVWTRFDPSYARVQTRDSVSVMPVSLPLVWVNVNVRPAASVTWVRFPPDHAQVMVFPFRSTMVESWPDVSKLYFNPPFVVNVHVLSPFFTSVSYTPVG